ncbi:MAG: porin [Muribaculaceae bacterium]|nr:porin [Muribaculaceae bacterium]
MKHLLLPLLIAAAPIVAVAQSDSIPERAIILSGDATHPNHVNNIAELYSRENMAFNDPAAPRFLFLDKKGKVALGIGGSLKATAMYDFNGAIDNNEFVTNQIPVPFNPAQSERFGATAAYSSIFLKMVATETPVGRVVVYIQTEFSGDDGNYGLTLKQAYATVGHLTLGKARSTFSDAPAMAPTVDEQGPSGQVSAKQMLIRYNSSSYNGFSWAISTELPSASYTVGTAAASIAQRFPDIPAYIQYSWKQGAHVRVSGILRELSYRNNVTNKNRFATGWGVQLSAVGNIVGGLGFFGHYTYGKGIGEYINDLSGEGLDLVPDAESGKLHAPAAAGWTAGLRYDFSPKFFITGSYSRAQLYKSSAVSPDTYRYGQYIDANAFYNPWSDLTIGLEYVHGTRKNADGQAGRANRITALVQYSF